MKSLSNTALWMALAVSSQGAIAGTMRCGDTVMDDAQLVPATAAQVLAACGEPTSRASGQWVYEQPGQLTEVLQFDAEGNLQSISEQPADD